MPNGFEEMDNWTNEQVMLFKEPEISETITAELAIDALELQNVRNVGTIVAQGDSWFDYLPGTDIIDCLKRHYRYDISKHAKAGDTLENMIYGTDINRHFERISPPIDVILRRLGQLKPKVFLFSGGGNDVAGEEFESYLNHNNSGLPVLREQFVNNMINTVFRTCFEDLISRVAEVSRDTHIVVHGYGRTVPTGQGVNFLFFTFAGPWLRPALAKKGIFDPLAQREAVFTLIDRFNDMLQTLDQNYSQFHYVDLRDMLDPDNDWVDELHLRNSAYARVAERIHQQIQSL